jgi:hypothetical protein
LRRGEVILFTGAGFSLDAMNRGGAHVPSVSALRAALLEVAFGEPIDDGSSLGDAYEVAVTTARNNTRDLLEDQLRVDAASLPESYEQWYAAPWLRSYTLNIDDLDEAVARRFELPRALDIVSAISQQPLGSAERLLSIHLNGTLDDFPDVTFSQPQYGERLGHPDFWYQSLVRDLRGFPVLFVGTTLDEPQLWQHVEMRGRRGEGRELRPGSYLVTPSLPAARRAILKEHFNVDWIPMTQGEFASEVLSQLGEALEEGRQHFAWRSTRATEAHALIRVADVRTQPAEDLREYVMGREPVWADLGPDGYAVHRSFESDLEDEIDASEARVVLVSGTGGAGKTTTLMRLALSRQARGEDVRWVDLESEVSLPRLRAAIRDSSADAVFIDDLESFGAQSGPLVAEIVEESPELMVFGGVRASRYEALNLEGHLADIPFLQRTIPHLEDDDIELLLDSLDRAQRLGQLRGKTRDEQIGAFQREAGRQLLVAMIQATSGERFEEKVSRECRELGAEAGFMYAVVAVATSLRQHLTRQEIVLASGEPSNEALNRLQGLLNQHLLTASSANQIRLRHRVIAEAAVDYFRQQRQLAGPVRGLMFSLATGLDPTRYPRSREGRLLIRLMNHDWLIRNLPGDRQGVRAAYDAIEDLVGWDHHYWLQRGSFEVETGDLQLAQNMLEQARSMAPDDYKVQTEWAYMVIKRASQNPTASDASDRVEEAFLELEDAVSRRGHQDAYPAHVMGSQGLSWVRQAPLGRDAKLGVLARLRGVVDGALRLHPRSGDLRQLSRDLEQEYLLVGTT